MKLILLLLLTISQIHLSFCDQILLEVQQDKLFLSNTKLLQFNPTTPIGKLDVVSTNAPDVIKKQDIKVIDKKYAIDTQLLKNIYGLSLTQNLCSGHCAFELELFIDKTSRLDETLFLYSSTSMHERDSPILLNFNGLEREKWVKVQLWMPDYLPRVGDEADLQISNPTKFRLNDSNSPLSQRARRALQYVLDITQQKGIYLHSISIKKSKLDLLNYDEKAIIKKSLSAYPSYFETTWSIAFLYCFFGVFFLIFLYQVQHKLSLKILLGFVIPIMVSLIFLASQEVNGILRSIETNELYKTQKALQNDVFQVNNIGEKIENEFFKNLEHDIVPKIKTAIKSLRDNNISLNHNIYAKENLKVKQHLQDLSSLKQFKAEEHLDLLLNKIANPYNINLTIANDQTIFYSNNYYLDKGVRHITSIFQKYVQSEISPSSSRKGRKQIEAMRNLISQTLNNTDAFDQFINNPSIPIRLHKHSMEKKITSSQVFWTYFIEKRAQKDIVWLIFGGLEKQAVQASLKTQLQQFFNSKQHSFDQFYFLGDNLLGSISNDEMLSNTMFEVCSYAKINRSFSFFPKIEDKQLYFYSYQIYEPTNLYSFTLRKSGNIYLKQVQLYKNYLYVSIFILFFVILFCSYFLSLLIVHPMLTLSKGMTNIENGNLEQNLTSTSKDQFNDVSQLLNQILQSLREKQHLSKFLSEMALKSLEGDTSISTRKDQYIMFCGIQNIKELESSLGLEGVIEIIDLFLQEIQVIIVQHHGKIDKFTGKSSLSTFDGQLDPKILVIMLYIIQNNLNNFINTQQVNLKFGVGLAKGSVVLGHVGAKQRKDFTAIGSTVNKAARLEALANVSTDHLNIYFDQACLQAFEDIDQLKFRVCDNVTLKGYKEEQAVYELL